MSRSEAGFSWPDRLREEKDKELAANGASIGALCRPCIEHHIPAGRDAGLTEPELARAAEVAEATHRTAKELLLRRSHELLHATGTPAGVPLPLEPTSRLAEVVALGASLGANCHPLLAQYVAGALRQGLTASQVRSANKVAQIVQQHAAQITAGKAAAARGCGLRGRVRRTSPLRASDTPARHEQVPPDDDQVRRNVQPASRSSGRRGLHDRSHPGLRAGSGR